MPIISNPRVWIGRGGGVGEKGTNDQQYQSWLIFCSPLYCTRVAAPPLYICTTPVYLSICTSHYCTYLLAYLLNLEQRENHYIFICWRWNIVCWYLTVFTILLKLFWCFNYTYLWGISIAELLTKISSLFKQWCSVYDNLMN